MFYHLKGIFKPIQEVIDAGFQLAFPSMTLCLQSDCHLVFKGTLQGFLKVVFWQLMVLCFSTTIMTEVLRPKDCHFRKGGFAIVVPAGYDESLLHLCIMQLEW
jgi:hypothetical protein